MADSPATPAQLTIGHLERFWRQRSAIQQRRLHLQTYAIGRVLGQMPPGMIAEEVDAWLHRRRTENQTPPTPGYSDREFEAIMAAARSEVVAIRSRLKRAEMLLAHYERGPDSLNNQQERTALQRETSRANSTKFGRPTRSTTRSTSLPRSG
jgi:hypothetical protein